jgi:ABC-type antimicrobial peptide transport system permease subunit
MKDFNAIIRGVLGFIVGAFIAFLLMVILVKGGSGHEFTFKFLLIDVIKNPSAWLGAFIGGVVVGGASVSSKF